MVTLSYPPAHSPLWNPRPSNVLLTALLSQEPLYLARPVPQPSPRNCCLLVLPRHALRQAHSWRSPSHLVCSQWFPQCLLSLPSATPPRSTPLRTWSSWGWLTTNSFILLTSMVALQKAVWTSTPSGGHMGWWLNATSPHHMLLYSSVIRHCHLPFEPAYHSRP